MNAFMKNNKFTYLVETISKILLISQSTYFNQRAKQADPSKLSTKRRQEVTLRLTISMMIKDANSQRLLGIIRDRIQPDCIVNSDSSRSYDVLDFSEFHHVRINHSEKFAEEKNHIKGIENFWNQAKRHMSRYNDISKTNFHLFLKRVRVAVQSSHSQQPLEDNLIGSKCKYLNLSMSDNILIIIFFK